MPIKIITCPMWDARPPKQGIQTVNRAQRFICHHTAGHVQQLADPSITTEEEAKSYARAIQRYHMDSNGWNDSGHNFLVCRAGYILQGRWLTVSAIQARHMVRSAHCPGQNDQIGIEFEHLGVEQMTVKQRDAGAELMAWVSLKYGSKSIMPMDPHGKYIATSCPANLVSEIPDLRRLALQKLQEMGGT